MSWAEVFKINKNMKKALNEQLRDMKCLPMRVITSNTTYVPEKTGIYKIICVGAGGAGGSHTTTSYADYPSNVYLGSGGGGGVAIITLRLLSGQSYNVTVGTTASFSNIVSATAGTNGSPTGKVGEGGTASGGDHNIEGATGIGSWGANSLSYNNGGGVGVYLTELSRDLKYYLSGNNNLNYGQSILGFGGGGPVYISVTNGTQYRSLGVLGLPAGVIIIPLEMEE